MRNKLTPILLTCLFCVVALFLIACNDPSPFEKYDKDGYTVSVKYDANGGVFTTNVTTIVDTYNLSTYKENSEGNKELRLLAPDSPLRGKQQAYTATKDGYYLVGWYAERTEIKDAAGNVTGYTYDKHWSFDDDVLTVDPKKEYSAENAVITLYAAWIPMFTYDYEFYLLDGNSDPQLIGKINVNPWADTTITLPCDDAETGRVNAPNSFPNVEGKTYDKIYLDAEMTTAISTETLTHPGKINPATMAVEDRIMKVYCTTTEGVRYRISHADQLIKGQNLHGHYTLDDDLDFTGKYWPALFSANEFCGKIVGNGHTVRNVTITQTNTANTMFGLFGGISDTASVRDVTFDGITAKIRGFSNSANAAFGVFAGEIASGADIADVVLQNSTLEIVKSTALTVAVNSRNPHFGLAAAAGEINGIRFSTDDVTVLMSGSGTAEYSYTPDENGQFTLTVVKP